MDNSFLAQTAILVFANSPKEEMRQKSLFNAEELLEEFTNRTLAKVRETGISYFHYDEEQQVGDSFGERFVNAIQDVYQLGYEYVITLGNDTPQLRTGHILEALEQLCAGRTVLGPSLDGGFYLMGLPKSKFCATEFLELPWQTSSLRSSLIFKIHQKETEVHYLQPLVDIDNTDDIRLLLKRTRNILFGIKQYIKLIFEASVPSERLPYGLPNSVFLYSTLNKGSPAL